MKDEVYYRIFFKNREYTYYTDGYYDKSEALEIYAGYIEKYSEVALVKVIEKYEVVAGALPEGVDWKNKKIRNFHRR